MIPHLAISTISQVAQGRCQAANYATLDDCGFDKFL